MAESPDGFTPEAAIKTQLENLERWARANEDFERQSALRFWGLHTVALTAAVVASAAVPLWNQLLIAVLLSGIAGLCLVIEAVWSGPDRLGAAQQRALHELRELEHMVQLRWDAARLAFPNPYHPRRIAHALALLDTIATRREEIGKYLGGSHASPAAALSTAVGGTNPPRTV
ncbi:MAG: hypothetical protein JW751_15925 [Polyangiaceae bacterium]|nr:hypothetical protein [Polyangiaceae bacterium]